MQGARFAALFWGASVEKTKDQSGSSWPCSDSSKCWTSRTSAWCPFSHRSSAAPSTMRGVSSGAQCRIMLMGVWHFLGSKVAATHPDNLFTFVERIVALAGPCAADAGARVAFRRLAHD